jgi:hypothetical protein
MSVSTSTSSVSYVGNNSTSTAYVVPYVFFDSTDLKVYSVDASGDSTLLTITTQYTVSGGAGSTGSVTTTSAIPATSTVIITRSVPYTQLTSFTTGDRLPAASIEKALDKLTMESQQLSRNTMPDTASTSGSAPYVLGLSASGGSPSWVPQSSSGIDNGSITPDKLSAGKPVWDTSGNVGIGTSSPDRKLVVSGSVGAYGTGTARIAIDPNAGTGLTQIDVAGANALRFNINNAERLRIDPNGKVGIGTSSPDAMLDINGAQICRNDSSAGWIMFAPKYGTDPYGANWDRFEMRIDPNSQITYIGNSSGGTGSARALAFQTGAAERLRIDTSGNVGIGTSSPSAKLSVVGGQINLLNSGDSVSVITTTGGNVARLQLRNQNTGGRNWGISAWGSAGDGALYISDDTAAVNRLSIASDGTINTQGNPITNCPTTAKAWVVFDGNTSPYQKIAGYNVTSVTRVASSNFYVNFTTAFANTDYAPQVSMTNSTTSGVGNAIPVLGTRETGRAQVFSIMSNSGNAPATAADQISVVVFA